MRLVAALSFGLGVVAVLALWPAPEPEPEQIPVKVKWVAPTDHGPVVQEWTVEGLRYRDTFRTFKDGWFKIHRERIPAPTPARPADASPAR